MTEREWAAIPTVAPYYWECIKDGVIVRAEFRPGSDEREVFITPPTPFDLRAAPMREGMPTVEVPIEIGWEPIWVHRRRLVMNVGVTDAFGNPVNDAEPKMFEYVALGRRHLDLKREEVWVIFPDGDVKRFDSLAEALS